MKRLALILCLLVLGVVIGVNVLTPSTWQWSANNLQVKFYNAGNERRDTGRFASSVGWSKWDLVMGVLGGSIGSGKGQWSNGDVTIKETTNYRIAGVSPKGVSIRLQRTEERNGVSTSFDQVTFIPTHGIARVDVSPDIYLTGSFE